MYLWCLSPGCWRQVCLSLFHCQFWQEPQQNTFTCHVFSDAIVVCTVKFLLIIWLCTIFHCAVYWDVYSHIGKHFLWSSWSHLQGHFQAFLPLQRCQTQSLVNTRGCGAEYISQAGISLEREGKREILYKTGKYSMYCMCVCVFVYILDFCG